MDGPLVAVSPQGDDDQAQLKPCQVVLVLQGGGALGAYQGGVYQALHEADIEPQWVIGTSIGAINGALIAANRREERLSMLHAFWDQLEGSGQPTSGHVIWPGAGNLLANVAMVLRGIPGFFAPSPTPLLGLHTDVGVEAAAYYSTAPLHDTLTRLADFPHLTREGSPRLTVGAVNARTGQMRYFDSRDDVLTAAHVMASGALPPAFPAIRIDGDPYWDGGIYSNTPAEVVLEDRQRRDSLIFTVNVWEAEGPEPGSIWDVLGRQKDIQYASRADSHIAKQKQIHHLRQIIRSLARQLPDAVSETVGNRELASWGCGTTMHVVRLLAPRLPGEDHTKDIDFTPAGIRARWEAGYADTRRILARAPWTKPVPRHEGIVVHHARGA